MLDHLGVAQQVPDRALLERVLYLLSPSAKHTLSILKRHFDFAIFPRTNLAGVYHLLQSLADHPFLCDIVSDETIYQPVVLLKLCRTKQVNP